jgi:beta-glucosidase
MANVISDLNGSTWKFLEGCLIPPSSHEVKNYLEKSIIIIKNTVLAIFTIPVAAVTSVLATAAKASMIVKEFFTSKSTPDPKKNFSTVLEDSRLWEKLGEIQKDLIENPPGKDNPNFLYGTASCTYQDSGYVTCPDSQWHPWEKKILKEDNQSGKSLNLFELYKTDPMAVISRLEKLGVNCYRTSIEWSHIEPKQGEFNKDLLKVYVDFCKQLRDHGIEPMITLHHFSEPKWFHDLGSFEKEENISHFVKFSEYVYKELAQPYNGKPLVGYFCTINEPNVEAFSRFIRGVYSPGITFNFERAAHFLKGALKAHFAVYTALKKIEPDTKIGFTHQYLHFIPANPLVLPATKYLTHMINEITLNLFKTNTFEAKVPLACHVVEHFKPEEIKADFIGLQYYTRPIIGLTGSTTQNSEEAMTKMPFREDPAGLYEAIVETHKATNRPIIVTENGISTNDPVQRARYMERALYALREAERTLGKDVVAGYIQWCIVNNFEWDLGMNPQAFGAYSAYEGTISKEPKKGMEPFIKVAEAWKSVWTPEQQAAM